jgi:hypothetical protein
VTEPPNDEPAEQTAWLKALGGESDAAQTSAANTAGSRLRATVARGLEREVEAIDPKRWEKLQQRIFEVSGTSATVVPLRRVDPPRYRSPMPIALAAGLAGVVLGVFVGLGSNNLRPGADQVGESAQPELLISFGNPEIHRGPTAAQDLTILTPNPQDVTNNLARVLNRIGIPFSVLRLDARGGRAFEFATPAPLPGELIEFMQASDARLTPSTPYRIRITREH